MVAAARSLLQRARGVGRWRRHVQPARAAAGRCVRVASLDSPGDPHPPTPTPTLMPLPLHLSAPRSSPPPHPRPCDGCRRCRTPHRPTSQSSGSLSARGRRRRRAHPTESSGFAPSWRRRRRSWRRRSRAWWLPSRRCTCARCGRASTRTRTPRPATTRVDMCAECHVRRGPVRPDGARCGSQTPPGSLLQAL